MTYIQTRLPWMAFLRVLDAPRENGEGMLYQQITPYSYVGQDVYADGTEQINVPAGQFSALKIIAQVDIATVMPNWPHFVMRVVQPVVPKNTLYFQTVPPYRLLKQKGATFVGGPRSPQNWFASISPAHPQLSFPFQFFPPALVPGVPVAAATLGGSPIPVKHNGHL